ncbi:hypothetical protein BE20_53390 [Sorangium cellulosum]|uniref:Uncharacterized protein n=1 Tax=Sorangium cellulosum TaxID=56 RepID=A0A150T906_SORCE|nr:hypothetical protein BE18_49060 [Sorangium cellulosum]KYG01303.1 hypothetical protein BE20_53390 [Sorangium cellulosum]
MSTTGARSADEILGLEFDWLASDADGYVALFSTAGGGYAPDELLRDTDAHDAAIDAVLASPASTVARVAQELPPGLKNTWRMVAERGLFAFDSDPHGGPYRMVAAPADPIRIFDLPRSVIDVVERLKLRQVRFACQSVIHAELLQERE